MGVHYLANAFWFLRWGAKALTVAPASAPVTFNSANALSTAFGTGQQYNQYGAKPEDKNYDSNALNVQKDWGKNYKPLPTPIQQKPIIDKKKAIVKENEKPKLSNLKIGLIVGGSVAALLAIILLIAKK